MNLSKLSHKLKSSSLQPEEAARRESNRPGWSRDDIMIGRFRWWWSLLERHFIDYISAESFFCCSSQHPIAEKHQPSIIIATARTLLCCCWWYEIQFRAQITVITGTPFRGRSKKLIDFESDKTNKTQFHLEGELLLTTIHLPKAQVLKRRGMSVNYIVSPDPREMFWKIFLFSLPPLFQLEIAITEQHWQELSVPNASLPNMAIWSQIESGTT